MASEEHVDILRQGQVVWNEWRDEHPEIRTDLSDFEFEGECLHGMEFTDANLRNAQLQECDLSWTNLVRADLRGADLTRANISRADLSGANLSNACLLGATLVYSSLVNANLSGCLVYGVSAWDLELEGAEQQDLVICKKPAVITVDNIEVAQFMYLLLHNRKIRSVVDTITTKTVLILGSFKDERKAVLDALRERLRHEGLVPVMFDFAGPASRDRTGTVELLARMARFIVADLTDPSSIPHELAIIVPHLRQTPVQPIRLKGAAGYGMFDDLANYPWVLPCYDYENEPKLLENLREIVASAMRKAEALRPTNYGDPSG